MYCFAASATVVEPSRSIVKPVMRAAHVSDGSRINADSPTQTLADSAKTPIRVPSSPSVAAFARRWPMTAWMFAAQSFVA